MTMSCRTCSFLVAALGFMVPCRAFTTALTSSCVSRHASSSRPHHRRAMVPSSTSSSLRAHLSGGEAIMAASEATQAFAGPSSAASVSLFDIVLAENSSSATSSAYAQATPPPNVEALSNETNIAVFIVGLIPFAWATVEFWRRIAVGASFGTGSDSVVIIGEDDKPTSSRGRQVLGRGALAVAYVLFAVAALSVGIAVFSVVTAPPITTAVDVTQ